MTSHLKGILMTFIGVVILSPDSVLIRLTDADSWTVLFYRGLLMSIGVLILLLITYRSKTIVEFKKIGRGGLWIGWLHGIMTGTFVFAIMHTSIANTLVIISTGPIWIAIIAWLTLRERASLITWLAMIIVFIGIYIVMSANFGGQNIVGDIFALITAILMGFTFTLVRKYKTVNMVPTMAVGGIIAAIIACIFAPTLVLKPEAIIYVVAMGVILSISFSLITIAPRYMPAAEVGMIMPLETVLGTLIAWKMINEVPTNNAIIGGIIVVATLFFHAWYSANLANKEQKNK
ncbi:MAG: DMT family transporter [Candidatus Thioglobus sp.]|jgi:drug/metabolite transporter (DMT)-like permease|nr:DMT family transporter [Candidatus Thioglobus sp.]